jgi:ADP-L-glycero-D-manno-heptose 6-epimerase
VILITGGAGFIGSVLAARIERAGEDVVICDRLGNGQKWKNIAKRRLFAFVWPECLPRFLLRNRTDLSAIVHMAAVSSTMESDADVVFRTNFELSRALWTFCVEHEIPFLYASSGATYGDGSQGFDDDWSPEKLALLRPLNLYGWSKHAFDRFVAHEVHVRRRSPPHWNGFKLMNVYGPNEYHKAGMQSVIAQVFREVATAGEVTLFRSHRADIEDGQQRRDFVYVHDCVEVIWWALRNPAVRGIFNVGTGEAQTFEEVASATIRAMGRTVAISYVDMPESIRSCYQYFTKAAMQRLRAAGCDVQFHGLDAGVHDYVCGYLTSSEPYC